MKTRNYLLSTLLGLIAFTGFAQANSQDPLIFTSQPEIPGSIATNAPVSCYPYIIKNTLTTDSLPLDISLVPNTDPRISINHAAVAGCMAVTDCGDTLAKGASCTIIVKVNPSESATPSQASETLAIEYSPRYGALESNPPIVIDFVLPPPAVLRFSVLPDPPAQVIMGDNPTDFTYTIENVGEQAAIDIVPNITQRLPTNCEPSLVDFVSSTCGDSQPYTLQPGASCDLTLSVSAPSDTPSCDLDVQNEYTLSIAYEGVASTLDSNIDFYVVQPDAFLNFSVYPDIPPVVIQGDTTETFTFIVKNFGTASTTIGTVINTISPIVSPTPTIDIVNDTCTSASIASGGTCTLAYQINASTNPAVRNYTNFLSIPYDSGAETLTTQYSFAVVTSAPVLSLDCSSLSTIEIGSSDTVTCTLENSGNADATVLNPTIDMDYGFITLTGGSCSAAPFTLAAASSCTLEYTVAPVVVGTSSQDLNVSYETTPGNTVTESSKIEFYAYTAQPNNAYIAYSDLLIGGTPGDVRECHINGDGSLGSCNSAVPISGISALDFTTGNFAFTSAFIRPLDLNDKVQRCTASTFGSCVTTASIFTPNVYYGSFINFYTPTLAYLSNFIGAPLVTSASDNVQLCNVSTSGSHGSISCSNAWTGHNILGPTAIGLLKFNGTNQFAYLLNKTSDSLLLCTINPANGQFTGCVDSGAASVFLLSGTLDFISAGDLYVYVPLQVFTNHVDILKCQISGNPTLGKLSACTSVKAFHDPNALNALVVTSIKVVSLGGTAPPSGHPVAYVGYSQGSTNNVIACDIMPNGGFGTCTAPDTFPAPIQNINAL